MEAILLIGIQGAGKSTFYRERFFDTHVRINLDQLKTKHRQQRLLETCLATKQSFVIDNTNVMAEARARFIRPAREAGFRVIGYYFEPDLKQSIALNEKRGRKSVPTKAIFATYKRLEPPRREEGFDELYSVRLDKSGKLIVRELEQG